MSTGNTVVDQFNTNDEEISQPTMKIQSKNLWFNPLIKDYLEELKMILQVMNDSILTHALTASFAIPMKWLYLVASTAVYNRTIEIVTFQLTSSKSKQLTNK
ncbi:unnamed protein product [Lactuca virosa]|uniref:Uncharacterized protein n=1 Tax=Lactuca virosa TaxID=75947 RepID=A0AAU9N8N4_9ASTR|nr:unnamed protein product [Lactuca virosa]